MEVARYWRTTRQRYQLVGEVCPNCNGKIFPPRDVCPTCEKEAKTPFAFSGVGGGKIFQPLRVALTGLTVSPGIFDVLLYLGRDRSLGRIDAAVRYLAQEPTIEE